jgi:hypothetical protein
MKLGVGLLALLLQIPRSRYGRTEQHAVFAMLVARPPHAIEVEFIPRLRPGGLRREIGAGAEEALLHRAQHQFRGIHHPALIENVLPVARCCLERDAQILGQFFGAAACRDQAQHLALSRSEAINHNFLLPRKHILARLHCRTLLHALGLG